MKNLTLLLLATVFTLQSCEKQTSKQNKEQVSNNETWEIKQDNFAYTVEILDSLQFYAEQKNVKHKSEPLKKITDFTSAQKMLKGVVEFWDGDEEGESQGLRRILFRNRNTFSNKYNEEFFVAYYPTEDILLLEGGHSLDVSFTLKNAKQTEETGNPEYIVTSPNNQYLLNGFYEGQDCVSYFIQKNLNGQFENAIPLSETFSKNNRKSICQIKEAFWTDDHTLFLKEVFVFDSNNELKPIYYKVSITDAKPKPSQSAVFQSKNISDFVPEDYVIYKENGLEEIKGDLNKDGLEDLVLIIKKTGKEGYGENQFGKVVDKNRRGIIVLFNKGNHYQLALKNYDCFTSENEDGGVYYAPELNIEIKNGNLLINYLHGRYGYWSYTFRHRNNDFELIGYDASHNRGPMVESDISINFVTKKIIKNENINENAQDESEVVFKQTKQNIRLKELTRLSEIIDFDQLKISELYIVE